MSTTGGSRERLGFALGMGLAFMPLSGIPVRLVLSEAPALLSYGGAFIVGTLLGLLIWKRTDPAATSANRKGPGASS